MSKKKSDKILLLPGSSGWDLWKGAGSGKLILHSSTEQKRALEVTGIPSGELVMSFPVKELTALPMWLPSDREVGDDLINLQIEQAGLAQADDLGQLSDSFPTDYKNSEEQSLSIAVVLKAPREGGLPSKSPSQFDLSARFFEFEEKSVYLWQEFNQWVFVITGNQSSPVYFQGFSDSSLNANMAQEIKLSIQQLILQDVLESSPDKVLLWMDDEDLIPEGKEEFGNALGVQSVVAKKPSPRLPEAFSQLLPADTRAERVAKKQKKQRAALITCLFLAYLGLGVYLGYKLWNLEQKATQVAEEAEEITTENQVILNHTQKWNELGPLVDDDNTTLEMLLKTSKAAPNVNLRFKRAEFINQMQVTESGEEIPIKSISVIGEADKLEMVNRFASNLIKSKDFTGFDWDTPDANKTTQDKWAFNYEATSTQ